MLFNATMPWREQVTLNEKMMMSLYYTNTFICSSLKQQSPGRHKKRRVWRYQRHNQNPYIEEEQTTQWPKEKVQKEKQRSTKHTHKTKDRVTRTPLKTGGELRCYGNVRSSISTSGIRRVNLVTYPVISHEWGKDRKELTTSGTYPWSFVTQIFHNGQPSHGGDRNYIFPRFA